MARTGLLKLRRNDEGQVLVLFALFSFVIVGALALALDVGYLLAERRQAQSVADAAALAGGVALLHGEDYGSVTASAIEYGAANGLTYTGSDAASLDVDITGDQRDGRVEVDVNLPVQRFFVGAIYSGNWSVTARAVAEVHDSHDAEYALITLNSPGTKFNGNNLIRIFNGSAMTNDSVNANPSNSHVFKVDGTIDSSNGIYNLNPNWSAGAGMHENLPDIDDPLTITPAPSKPTDQEQIPPCTADCTWQPGWYHDDSVTINGKVNFAPGLYYFDNFDLSLQNTNSRIEGSDVMLYFDGDSTFDPKNGEMHVTSPETSPYPGGHDGMVFWMANCTTVESSGNTDYFFEGIFYAPCTDFIFSGTPSTPVMNGQMIVGSVEMKGTGKINIHYKHYVDTRVFRLSLVE